MKGKRREVSSGHMVSSMVSIVAKIPGIKKNLLFPGNGETISKEKRIALRKE